MPVRICEPVSLAVVRAYGRRLRDGLCFSFGGSICDQRPIRFRNCCGVVFDHWLLIRVRYWNRVKFNPKSRFFLPPGKDNVFHGMRISASQPADVLVALASQSPFHSALPARPPLIFALLVDRALTENRQRSLCFAERNGSSVTSR